MSLNDILVFWIDNHKVISLTIRLVIAILKKKPVRSMNNQFDILMELIIDEVG